MRDDPYIVRAKEAVRQAEKKAASYNGDCSDCAYGRAGLMGLKCAHPAVELVAFNLTDNYGKGRIVECAEQRDRESVFGPVVCGPNGALFERKIGLLARLFGKSERTGA